ncbi:MAG: hypothetical protein K5664_07065 [Firmicutes bacterium]|nr:hypothetical protein [Bacillota bacterium]
MICTKAREGITADSISLAVGDRVIATASDYAGLKGYIFEIRTGADKDTENVTDDVYCSFDVPDNEKEIKLLEEHFSDLYGEKKTIDDLPLDLVIMAPEELRRIGEDE